MPQNCIIEGMGTTSGPSSPLCVMGARSVRGPGLSQSTAAAKDQVERRGGRRIPLRRHRRRTRSAVSSRTRSRPFRQPRLYRPSRQTGASRGSVAVGARLRRTGQSPIARRSRVVCVHFPDRRIGIGLAGRLSSRCWRCVVRNGRLFRRSRPRCGSRRGAGLGARLRARKSDARQQRCCEHEFDRAE